jgi:hypothetical protein
MQPSLFERLTRYPVRPWMDPRENRLSSSLAAVLEHAPELARALMSRWIADVDGCELAVSVQHRISGGSIDVELRFGDPGVPELLVWIEAKHGAGLSGEDQIDKYRAELAKERAGRRVLLILAPVDFDAKRLDIVRVHEAAPDDDRTRLASWQELYAMAVAWRSLRTTGTVDVWLVGEFLRFLKEEGLEERPISQDDVVALDRMLEAMDTLAGVMRRAEVMVSQRWAKRLGPMNPTYTPTEEFRYPVVRRGEEPAVAWGDADLQWACGLAESSEDAASSLWAGLQSNVSGPLGQELNEAWICALEADGFKLGAHRKARWLGRSLPLAELAALQSSDDQARRLADFIVDSFQVATATTPGG